MREGPNVGVAGARFLALAIVAAPFLALLYCPEAGLIVMALALAAATLLLCDALPAAVPGARRWLRLAIGVNLALAAACLVLAAVLAMRG
jgi:hypothetical protein